MISVDDALARIFAQLGSPGSQTVPLEQAHLRVLAAPLVAMHNQPPFDASAMDGYAVRAAEVVPGRTLTLAGTSQAGRRFAGMMEHGQCVRIFTGAPMPIGADAVVIQEESAADGVQISFIGVAKPGQNVRFRGSDFSRGQELLPAGAPLSPAMLNLAASANYPELSVTKRPKIAVLATGDELVAPGGTPGPDQIIASNSYGLVPLLSRYAESVTDFGTVPDNKSLLDQVLLAAFDSGIDVLVTTGGASVGDRDYVREVLVDLGVHLDFWRLALRPGKPLMFGMRGRCLVLGLPGNAVSALVTAMVVVVPTLRRMTGHTDPYWPRIAVPITQDLPPNGERRHYRRGKLERNALGLLEVSAFPETDSGHSSSLARADALIVQPENDPGLRAGDIVDVLPLNWS